MARMLQHHKLGFFIAASSLVLATGLLALLVIVPAISPTAGAEGADFLRSILGPRPVAWLEGRSLAAQDAINRFLAERNGGQKAISLAVSNSAPISSAAKSQGLDGSSSPLIPGVVDAAPQIGWQPFGPLVKGAPAMAQTLLALDPQRPYAGIALVRIDLGLLKLHMVPGYQEPSHAPSVVAAIPHLGQIPAADQAHLIAAFNGGFKAINGHYGMMVNGVTLLPAEPGFGTLAIYKDGRVAIGAWGKDLQSSPDMVAFRQNCPLVIQNGSINPEVYVDSQSTWGDTIGNKEISWRTGVGITQDGRYLIYAVGNGTTVETLAQALLRAGAYNAMQLDINRPFAHFVTYQPAGGSAGHMTVTPLLNEMVNEPNIYLTPHYRDYFYLTAP